MAETKEWGFGFLGPKVIIEGEQIKIKKGLGQESNYPLANTSVSYEIGAFITTVHFHVSGAANGFIKVSRKPKDVEKVKEIQEFLAKNQKGKNSDSSSGLSDLEKLKDLKDKGIISESEFEQKKKQILGL